VRAATKDEKVCGIVENNTTKSGRARNLENAASCEAKLRQQHTSLFELLPYFVFIESLQIRISPRS